MSGLEGVSREQVLAFRLSGHHLDERQPPDALLAVAAACGLRNTPPGSAALAATARVADLAPAGIDRALGEDRTLVEVLSVRASPLVVPARDVAVFTLGALPADEGSLRGALPALAPALDPAGITAADALERAAAVAHEALAEGPLERGALSAAMTARLPEPLCRWCRPCGARHVDEMLFRLVGVRGVFVLAREGSRTLYVRAEDRLRGPLVGDASEARAGLLRRYLRCFGPSTAADFAGWAGIGSADAQRSWDASVGDLVAVDRDGRGAWVLAADVGALESATLTPGVRLLPPYDAYLDQRDRATLLPDRSLQRRVWQVLGNPGAVLVDGELAGVWRPRKQGRRLTLNVETWRPVPPPTRAAIEAEAARLAPQRGCTTAAVTFAG